VSLKDLMIEMEAKSATPPATSVAAISEFRDSASYKAKGRILSLTYEPGYAYLLPGDGIVSEPTYSLVDSPNRLLAASPEAVATYLRKRNIRHVAVSLQSRLFTTIAYTSLFDPREIAAYFSLSYEGDGDFFILTMRDAKDGSADREKSIPQYFLMMMDLKRNGALNLPFADEFTSKLVSGTETVSTLPAFEQVRLRFLREMEDLIRQNALSALALDSSKAVVTDALRAATTRARTADVRSVLQVQTSGRGRLPLRLTEREVRARLLSYVRKEIETVYVAELGRELAQISMRCDERVPFAARYPSHAKCP
jgi:Arc/MetJ family transcription regulator